MKRVAMKIGVFLCISGCMKEMQPGERKSTVEKQAVVDSSLVVKQADQAANPNNPFDWYGALHNEGMNYVLSCMTRNNAHGVQSVSDYVHQFAKIRTGKENTTDYDQLYQSVLKDSAHFYAALIEHAPVSVSCKNYLKQIFGVVTSRVDAKEFVYADVKADLLRVENDILENPLLEKAEKEGLLKGCSLARYSSYWWITHLSQASSKSIFGKVFAVITGVCADLSTMNLICQGILYQMTADVDPIAISSAIYDGMMYL